MTAVDNARAHDDYELPVRSVEEERAQKTEAEISDEDPSDNSAQPKGFVPIGRYADSAQATVLPEDKTIEGVLVEAGAEIVSGEDEPLVVFQSADPSGETEGEVIQRVFFTQAPNSETVDEFGAVHYTFDNYRVELALDGTVRVYEAGAIDAAEIYGSADGMPAAQISGVYSHDRGTKLHQAQTADTPDMLQSLINNQAWVSPTGETDDAIFEVLYQKYQTLMPERNTAQTPEALARMDLIQSIEAKRLIGELDEGIADVFGGDADVQAFMAQLDESMLTGDFSWVPTIRFMERGAEGDDPADGTLQGANGAYVTETNEIVIAADLQVDREAINFVGTHELGHAIDAMVHSRAGDTQGDEGEAFSLWMGGMFYDDSHPSGLSDAAQAAFNADSDAGSITHPETGETMAVEFFKRFSLISSIVDDARSIVEKIYDEISPVIPISTPANETSDEDVTPLLLPGLTEPYGPSSDYQLGDPLVYTDDNGDTRVVVFGNARHYEIVEQQPPGSGVYDIAQGGFSVIGGPQQIDFFSIADDPSPDAVVTQDIRKGLPNNGRTLVTQGGYPHGVLDLAADPFSQSLEIQPRVTINLQETSADENEALARETTDFGVLELLSDLGDRRIDSDVAQNDATSEVTLSALFETYSNDLTERGNEIIASILRHPNTSDNVIETALGDLETLHAEAIDHIASYGSEIGYAQKQPVHADAYTRAVTVRGTALLDRYESDATNGAGDDRVRNAQLERLKPILDVGLETATALGESHDDYERRLAEQLERPNIFFHGEPGTSVLPTHLPSEHVHQRPIEGLDDNTATSTEIEVRVQSFSDALISGGDESAELLGGKTPAQLREAQEQVGPPAFDPQTGAPVPDEQGEWLYDAETNEFYRTLVSEEDDGTFTTKTEITAQRENAMGEVYLVHEVLALNSDPETENFESTSENETAIYSSNGKLLSYDKTLESLNGEGETVSVQSLGLTFDGSDENNLAYYNYYSDQDGEVTQTHATFANTDGEANNGNEIATYTHVTAAGDVASGVLKPDGTVYTPANALDPETRLADNLAPEIAVINAAAVFADNLLDPEFLGYVFGDDYDPVSAQTLHDLTMAGDLSWLPDLEMVPQGAAKITINGQGVIGQDGQAAEFHGAYSDGTVFFNEMLFGGSADADATKVVVAQELAHHIEHIVNPAAAESGAEGILAATRLYGGPDDQLTDEEVDVLRNREDEVLLAIGDGDAMAAELGFFAVVAGVAAVTVGIIAIVGTGGAAAPEVLGAELALDEILAGTAEAVGDEVAEEIVEEEVAEEIIEEEAVEGEEGVSEGEDDLVSRQQARANARAEAAQNIQAEIDEETANLQQMQSDREAAELRMQEIRAEEKELGTRKGLANKKLGDPLSEAEEKTLKDLQKEKKAIQKTINNLKKQIERLEGTDKESIAQLERHQEFFTAEVDQPLSLTEGGYSAEEQAIFDSIEPQARAEPFRDTIVNITRTQDGNPIFLDEGNAGAGYEHLVLRHSHDFARELGWAVEDIAQNTMQFLQTAEPVSVSVADNGLTETTYSIEGPGGVMKAFKVITDAIGRIITAFPQGAV